MSYILHTSSPSLKMMTDEVRLSSFPDEVVLHDIPPCSNLLERCMYLVKYLSTPEDAIVVHSFKNINTDETVYDSYPTIPGSYLLISMRCSLVIYGSNPSELILNVIEDVSRIYKVHEDGTVDFGYGYKCFSEFVQGLIDIGESDHGIAVFMGLASKATTFAMYSIPLSILPIHGTVLNNIRGNVEFPFKNPKGVLENA